VVDGGNIRILRCHLNGGRESSAKAPSATLLSEQVRDWLLDVDAYTGAPAKAAEALNVHSRTWVGMFYRLDQQ